MVSVRSRAHRTLRRLADFRDLVDFASEPPGLGCSAPLLHDSEEVVGLYSRTNDTADTLLFTTKAIMVCHSHTWQRVDYSDIDASSVVGPKTAVTGIKIITRNSETIFISLLNYEGSRFSDAFEILRFLGGVSRDVRAC